VLVLDGLGRTGAFDDVNVAVRPRGDRRALRPGRLRRLGDRRLHLRHRPRHERRNAARTDKPIAPRSPEEAQRLGIALLPANRKLEGMFGFQSIAFNISAGHLKLLSRFGTLVDRAREKTVATDMIKRLAVRTPHERQPISAMSGGNAQKVVLARQLVERPEVLVLAEPTQGVDVGAKEEIHRIITELAENGTACWW
jgi:rhamnose transport system ATP-binding protein